MWTGRWFLPQEQTRSQPTSPLVSAVSSEKKEGWSWESYLEEQKAVTAPVSLFQDVSRAVSAQAEFILSVQGLTTESKPSGVFYQTILDALTE